MKENHKQLLFFLFLMLLSSGNMAGQTARFVVLPDTQTYLESEPEIFEKQIAVIASQADRYDALIHLGDITQDNHPLEWYTVARAFEVFDANKLPYTFTLGNHDMGSAPGKFADTRNSDPANKYFPLKKMQQKPYWGGSLDETVDNHYIRISAGDTDWLIISLEFGPSDKALEWAGQVVGNHPDHTVIVNTHAYMYSDSTRMGEGDYWLPENYGIGKNPDDTVNNGEKIWEKFVSKHPNIIAVLSGHVLNSGLGTLVSQGDHGNNVYQMLSNFQRGVEDSKYVKDGFYRVLTFDKSARTITVETVSAVTGKKHPSDSHNFTFENVKFN